MMLPVDLLNRMKEKEQEILKIVIKNLWSEMTLQRLLSSPDSPRVYMVIENSYYCLMEMKANSVTLNECI